jgi:hypothetical protein
LVANFQKESVQQEKSSQRRSYQEKQFSYQLWPLTEVKEKMQQVVWTVEECEFH